MAHWRILQALNQNYFLRWKVSFIFDLILHISSRIHTFDLRAIKCANAPL
jgi:hypothetical protein